MTVAVVVAAILVGLSFVVAAITKFVARDVWASGARELGAPVWSIPVVPWAEVVVGALLVAQLVRRWAAIAAIVMLVAFTALILLQLRRGNRPPCACFGGSADRPIGVEHLIRNAVLIALATFVAVAG